jgi:hypothetical protein
MIFSNSKRILSAFLSLTMVGTMVASVPFTASAATAKAASVSFSIFENNAWKNSAKGVAGTANKKYKVSAVKASLSNAPKGAYISYSIYESKKWVSAKSGKVAGTAKKNTKVYAEAFKATLKNASAYTLSYSIYENKKWVSGKDGASIGKTGKKLAIEAIKISIAKKPVAAVTVKSVSAVDDLNVDNGTDADTAANLLPSTVDVKLSNGKTASDVGVTWTAGSDYSATTAGTYAFTGKLDAISGVKNTNGVTATANVIVSAVVVTVKSVADTAVTTTVGKAPTLPATVTATYTDGSTKDLAVTWDAIDASKYAAAGTFTVSGTIADTDVKATATVTVAAPTVVSVAAAEVTTAAGVDPSDELPDAVTATLSDGSTKDVVVTWAAVTDASSYATAGNTFKVNGTIDGTTVLAVANVTVTDAVVASAADVDVSTVVGIKPVLPAKVTATYTDASLKDVAVTWEDLDPSDYATADVTYTVDGTIDGTDVVVTANVTVKAATIASITGLEVSTPVGIDPTDLLDEQVTATYTDGKTDTVEVAWDKINDSDYASAGTSFTVNGTVEGTTIKAVATVKVTDAIVTDITAVPVATVAGTKPVLPATVSANFSDGSTQELAVKWADIDASKYAAAGTFDVTGTVAESEDVVATANVTVSAPVITAVAAPAAISTNVGIVPTTLPATVSATYNDGSVKDVAVTWAAITADQVAKVGTVTVVGTVDGFATGTTLTVNVTAPTVVSIAPVTATTTAGTAPVIPTAVTATYTDGSVKTLTATWAAIDASKYAVAGTFDVTGTVAESTTVTATATVTVTGVAIKSTSATGAKLIQVAFPGPIDTTKAAFTVKKGSIVINVASVAFSTDKTTATLTLASNLTAGDYTTTVTGLTATALTSTFTAADQKAASIQFTSTTAVLDRSNAKKIYVGYKVYNQYNEDVTATIPDTLTATAGRGVATAVGSTGIITIDNSGASDYVSGDKVSLSVIDATANVFASTVLTVGDKAQVSDITFGTSLYNSANSTAVLNTAATASDFNLTLAAKDQYGNAITDVTSAGIASDVIVTDSNPTVVDVNGGYAKPTFTTTSINGTNTTTLQLKAPAGGLTAGTATISIISKTTGHIASYTVTVLATAKVDTIVISAPSLAVGGETTVIPFSAVDQFGSALTNASVLNSGMTISASRGTISFVQNYVTNTAELKLVEPAGVTAATTVVITAITGTSKVQQLSITVQPDAVPVVIAGTTNFTPNLALTATEGMTKDNIVFNDQYGRAITPTIATGGYTVGVVSGNTADVTVNNAVIDNTNTNATFTGVAKGSSTVTLTLLNAGVAVANSAYTFTSSAVDNASITSYQLADFANLEAGTPADVSTSTAAKPTPTDHQVAVTVTGTLANGSTVVIPAAGYTVTLNDANVSYNGTKLVDDGKYGWTAANVSQRTVPVIVTVFGDTTPTVLTKSVTVVNAVPAIATIALDTTNAAYVSAGVVKATAATVNTQAKLVTFVESGAIATTDQFGIAYAPITSLDKAVVIASNFTNSHDITSVVAGDTFNVTVVTTNSKILTFKVLVQ